MKSTEDFEIAPGYRVGDWKKLVLDPDDKKGADWLIAIDILKQRIERRFFDPVRELINLDSARPRRTFGFAILAIDFLVAETLQGFRRGFVDHKNHIKELFEGFLVGWDSFRGCVGNGNIPESAKKVYERGRCALHHSGSTDGEFYVGVSGPMFVFGADNSVRPNRNCFHESLQHELTKYLDDLRGGHQTLRKNFKTKMNAICGSGTEEIQ